MSVAAISAGNPFQATQQIQSNQKQQFQQELQQLGKDIQSGNLSAAQADFATLQQGGSISSTARTKVIAQAFNRLGQDLQSGNTTAAQQDYAKLQQELKNAVKSVGHYRHPHRADGGSASNSIGNLLQQLGQDLQARDLSGARQAYNSLTQDFQEQSVASGAAPSTRSSAVSVSA
jgi:hypothetical protein